MLRGGWETLHLKSLEGASAGCAVRDGQTNLHVRWWKLDFRISKGHFGLNRSFLFSTANVFLEFRVFRVVSSDLFVNSQGPRISQQSCE